jgi:hypothetical protein
MNMSVEGNAASTYELRGKLSGVFSNIIDNTLSIEGAGADAKATGDAISGVSADLTAHKSNKKNPHGVTATQVGARPETWTPTALEVGARPNTWLPTIAEIGAAPSGFGSNGEIIAYKGVVKSESELQTLLANELSTMKLASKKTIAAGFDFGFHGAGYYIIDIYKMAFDGYAYADAHNYGNVRTRYTLSNNVWIEEEWLNPPMIANGVEFRTMERHNGKPVYVRAYNFGACNESNWWSWGAEVANNCDPVRVEARVGQFLVPSGNLSGDEYKISSVANHNGFSLYVLPSFVGAEVTVKFWYTKL